MNGDLPADFDAALAAAIAACVRRRKTSPPARPAKTRIQALAPALPEFLGGSADLTGSNLTNWKECVALRSGQPGNHINYGVREFGMSAIMNGVTLHGGFIPFGATFLTFSDYSRNALRMAALMKLRSIFVFTHDSIGLGEDGPTHQSVEHIVVDAPDPQPGQLAPVRHGRVGGGLGRGGQAQGRSIDPDLLAPEPAVPGAQRRNRSPTSTVAAMC